MKLSIIINIFVHVRGSRHEATGCRVKCTKLANWQIHFQYVLHGMLTSDHRNRDTGGPDRCAGMLIDCQLIEEPLRSAGESDGVNLAPANPDLRVVLVVSCSAAPVSSLTVSGMILTFALPQHIYVKIRSRALLSASALS